uniref:DJ-1/PfpI domain-containing protein n=1 Tax=Glossina brevipalpis TaxID=37001 RepID=A0A1A9W3U5_9MUSC
MNICRVFSHFNCSTKFISKFLLNSERSRNFCKKCEITKSGKSALLVFTEGSGEILVAVISDILRRTGIDVSICGLCDSEPTKCSKDVVIKPDTFVRQATKYKYDVVIIPGGLEGAKKMAKDVTLGKYLTQHYKEGRLLAAICCGPLVLAANNIAPGCRLTSYPARKGDLEKIYKYVDDEIIVQDGKLLTSRAPGTAMKFALKISEILAGNVKTREVAKELLIKDERKKRTNFSNLSRIFSQACRRAVQELNYKTRLRVSPFLANVEHSRLYSEKKSQTIKENKSALIIFTEGAEEMEVVISADVLRRAEIDVVLAGLCDDKPVKCAKDLVIVPDTALEKVVNRTFSAIVLPGGMDSNQTMAKNAYFGEYLKEKEKECYIAAICSGPLVLAAHKIGQGKRITSYPALELDFHRIYKYECEDVVVDGKMITSRGPGTVFQFALKIVELLRDKKKAEEVAKLLLVQDSC